MGDNGQSGITQTADAIPQPDPVIDNSANSPQGSQVNSTARIAASEQKGTSGNLSGVQGAGENLSPTFVDEAQIVGGLKAVFKPSVPYPQAAQDGEIQGEVEVAITVSTLGNVEDISILRTSHPIFEGVVRRVVKTWRFKPVVVGGMPVRVKAVQHISFRLD